jgi:uncharacterized protein (TIGR02996 family)
MRYEATFFGYDFWWNGRERTVPTRTSTLTMTRRGDTLAFRLVRRNKKTRWARTFGSTVEAEQASIRLERALQGAGYKLLDGEDIKLPPRDPLEKWKAACFGSEGSEGDDARLVYADFLTERRDPRGELIVAQANAEDDQNAVLVAERILQSHRATFLGPLDGSIEPGQLTWRRGFFDTLVLDSALMDRELFDSDRTSLLVDVITHPSGELLRELIMSIDAPSSPPAVARAVSDVVAMVAALAPQGLEALTLRLGMSRRNQVAMLGDLTPVLALLPRLQTFKAEGIDVTLASPFIAPSLTDLVLDGKVDDLTCESLVCATIPKLERLVLRGPEISRQSRDRLNAKFGSRLEFEVASERIPPPADDYGDGDYW